MNTTRHGWATVPALLMLTVIASITAAMASVSWTNVKSAKAMISIGKAQSTAESGLLFASKRLQNEVNRYIVSKGVIDSELAEKLWRGTWTNADGQIVVLEADEYVIGAPSGSGIAHRLKDVFSQVDTHWIELTQQDESLPTLSDNEHTLELKPIALDVNEELILRLTYTLLDDDTRVLIKSVGESDGITRTISMEFNLTKRVDYAIYAMSKIMLGRNVSVEGPIGTRFGTENHELNDELGTPLIMLSDFFGLDPIALDSDVNDFAELVLEYDVDGDNRLRPNHPTEGQALGGAMIDYDNDQYVTELDLFLSYYDSNGDVGVVYDPALAAYAGHPGLTQEFSEDIQLASLIDHARSDRNEDGVVDDIDRQLGWDDGIIDVHDRYAKIDGYLAFAVEVDAWENETDAQWQSGVQGPITPDYGDAATKFQVSEDELTELTTSMFADAQTWFETESLTGEPFGDAVSGQVASNLDEGGSYIPAYANGWEGIPWESEGAYDWYQRPIFRDMSFTNVRIPIGTNALFDNCTFVGVTWIETTEDVDDPNWNYTGALMQGDDGYEVRYEDMTAATGGEVYFSTRELSNNVRFHDCTFLGSLAGDVPNEFTHWRNKIQVTGESRFFLDSQDPDLAEQDDAAELQAILNSIDPQDIEQLSRSSVLLPGWSVEIGTFQNNETVGVKLTGTIISGLIDLRGVIDVHGSILSTFRPKEGSGPLYYGGEPDAFNTTIGYFGPTNGDGEGVNDEEKDFDGYGRVSLRANPNGLMPDGVPWPITIVADGASYKEGF